MTLDVILLIFYLFMIPVSGIAVFISVRIGQRVYPDYWDWSSTTADAVIFSIFGLVWPLIPIFVILYFMNLGLNLLLDKYIPRK